MFIEGLFKIDGRPFRVGVLTGAVVETKMEPKWTYKYTKQLLRTHLENLSENLPQKASKMNQHVPQCIQNCTKNRSKIYMFPSCRNGNKSYGSVPANVGEFGLLLTLQLCKEIIFLSRTVKHVEGIPVRTLFVENEKIKTQKCSLLSKTMKKYAKILNLLNDVIIV